MHHVGLLAAAWSRSWRIALAERMPVGAHELDRALATSLMYFSTDQPNA